MKKIIFTALILIFSSIAVYSQKGINFNYTIPAGRSLHMFVDSAAKNVYYALQFPNQPNTTFSFLPDVNHISFQFNFRKTTNIEPYRYTILVDDKPIEVNKSFDMARFNDTHAGGDEEIFNSTIVGNFHIKGKVITILCYSIEKPLEIYKSVFYAKPIPKAILKALGKRFTIEKGVDYNYIIAPKEQTSLKLTNKDDEITIVKDRTAIDYIYHVLIKDIQSNKIIYESTAWQYGGHLDELNHLAPYIKFDKSTFKKSGEYEIVIQPMINWTNCLDCNMSTEQIEKYSSKYFITVDLEEEATFTVAELGTYIGITGALVGMIAGFTIAYVKRKSKTKFAAEQQQKQLAHLQLDSIRSQLNPHFLFNALAGIQNLMNKNETDKANKYLSKFARITRNVLENRELISLTEEKKLLDDYLQMEQLRFGFQYHITISNYLDTENTEIPSMLLQPFVENAVKHGIAEKGNEGKIKINFEKQSSNLILQIEDNGNGFQTDKNYKGLGLSLSKNRITILNNIYKETPFIFDIKSDGKGTVVSITLTEWL